MTETLSKPSRKAFVDSDNDEAKPYSNVTRKVVLNYIFRNIPFTQANKVTLLSLEKYRKIRNALDIPIPIIRKIFNTFVADLLRFKLFVRVYTIGGGLKSPVRKSRVYLRKIYRIAPVFDYRRAKINTQILDMLLKKVNYRPQIMTQVAVVLFVTEVKSMGRHKTGLNSPIAQNKICVLCDCSPYAFHRCRNKIGIDHMIS